MPPHCDSMDGPVVKAAEAALGDDNVELILPFVPADAEDEVRTAFERATAARAEGPIAHEVADLYFFDTVVRLHRAGEGAPFTGVKPAGGDVGPVIPLAEDAIETGSVEKLHAFLSAELHRQLQSRLDLIVALTDAVTTAERREYTEAMLGLQVYSHHLYKSMHRDPHEGGHSHG
ncbi:hypothetical protein RAJCM14343_5014 [Rhodococcus aetherivorans]|uniref:Uncharacterized protein n=1 Tax=Rhodococcus aetherivorans TaxID=191292 RepID=A0ABQ0YSX0_9NOCA|nr:DUF6448 family protein [Rhodococcus aetherivorans]ETT26673.1 hypothetical protein RR21198_2703 [Rhodococcus rhodochrous ATCC 21198]GES39738.1 hypothetical protein RAJCM14343_5014 [Rhodococcus aetherivorans]